MRTDSAISLAELERAFGALEAEGRADMKEDGFADRDIRVERSLDCRYLGQSYEITVPFRSAGTPAAAFVDDFHRRHHRLYTYHHARRPVEVVNLRIKAVAVTPKVPLVRARAARSIDPRAALRRQPITTGKRRPDGTVYDRSRLRPGNCLPGPALVIDPESTAYLPPGYSCRVDGFLNLIIRKARSA